MPPIPKIDWNTKAVGALKQFGENLVRRAEVDPRLARAVEQGYDLRNPTLHGTNAILPATEGLRPLYSTPEPGHALDYTGGGRRAGTGSPKRGGVTYPMVTRGTVLESPYSVDNRVPYAPDDLKWLEKLGLTDPEAFFKAVQAKNAEDNAEAAARYTQLKPDSSWGMSFVSNQIPEKYYPQNFYRMVENPAFRDELVNQGIDILDFAHPYYTKNIGPKGRVRSTGVEEPSTARFIMNPAVVRSPFAAFEEEGIGLMKKKGGLVRMRGY